MQSTSFLSGVFLLAVTLMAPVQVAAAGEPSVAPPPSGVEVKPQGCDSWLPVGPDLTSQACFTDYNNSFDEASVRVTVKHTGGAQAKPLHIHKIEIVLYNKDGTKELERLHCIPGRWITPGQSTSCVINSRHVHERGEYDVIVYTGMPNNS